MLKTLIAPMAAAFAVVLLAGVAAETSQAASRGQSGGGARSYSGGGGNSFSRGGGSYSYGRALRSYGDSGKRYYSHNHARHYYRNRGVYVGVPLYGVYAYSDDCYWLRRRAAVTGSPYWWNRYYACLDGGYY